MTSSLVSIIIVNWNGFPYLKICLSLLQKINYPNYEIILVDNGSTDGSVEMVKEFAKKHSCQFVSGTIQTLSKEAKRVPPIRVDSRKPTIRLIENRTNLGFAKANNQGFEKAKGEYILFLNNDTKVTPDFLTKLVKVLESDRKIGVVQPKIILMDSKRLQAGGTFLINTGFLYHFGYGKDPDDKKYNQQMEIFSANGSCMLVRREVIEKVGLFDPDFFCYFEETDFCWRVWLAGYKIVYVPSAIIYHKGGQTAQRLSLSFVNFFSFKNRIHSLMKNLGFLEFFRILPGHLLFCQLAALGFLITGKFSSAWAVQKAVGWNFLNLKKTLEKRRKVQNKIRKIPDRKLIPKIKRSVRPLYYYYLFTGPAEYEN